VQNILIVEDHADALSHMKEIVGEAYSSPSVTAVSTLSQARTALVDGTFDLVVLDLGLPDGRGETFIAEILNQQPNAYVVISTIHDESERLLEALQQGAKGYLLKEQPRELLVAEFSGITQGKPPFAPAVTRRLLEFVRLQKTQPDTQNKPVIANGSPNESKDEFIENDAFLLLTTREKEVLALVGKGFNRPEIAGILSISKHTVATHLSKIYEKLGVANRSEAVLAAYQFGLI